MFPSEASPTLHHAWLQVGSQVPCLDHPNLQMVDWHLNKLPPYMADWTVIIYFQSFYQNVLSPKYRVTKISSYRNVCYHGQVLVVSTLKIYFIIIIMTHTILLVGLKNGHPVNHHFPPMSAAGCTSLYEVIVLQEGYAFTTESGKTNTFSLTPLRFPVQL